MRLPVVLALVLVPAIALAKPKVAIVPLDNDSGDVQDAVVEALDGDEVQIVGPKQVARAADKLGLEGDFSEKELKKLAKELEAQAVVQGSLSTKGSNKVLHFKLFVKGKKQKGFKIEFGSAKSPKFKKALHDKLIEKLGDLGGGGGDDEDKPKKTKKGGGDDDEDKPKKTKKGGGDDDEDKPKKTKKGGDDDEDKPKKTKKGGDDDEDKPKKTSGDDDEDKPKKRTASADDEDGDEELRGRVEVGGGAGHAANRWALRVDAGISVTGRSLTFNSKQFTEGVGNPKAYSNAPVPGARVEGELYPAAFSNPMSGAAGLGVGGSYDRTFSLTLHNALQPTTAFPATEFRWNLGARYRLTFGSKATSPSVTFGFDYAHRQFKVDRANQMGGVVIDIPDVEYVGVLPNATIRVPITPAVALVVNGGSLLAMRTGSIQQPEQYGQAKVTSFEASGGIDITFAKKFALRFTGDFALYGFAFTGNGQMANGRDGDPTTPDVGGAADRYIGGAATFAVMY